MKNKKMFLALKKSPFLKTVSLSLLGFSFLIALVAIWKIPQLQSRSIEPIKEQVEVENSCRGILLQIIGGVFVLGTTYCTFQTLQSTKNQEISGRFSKAIEQIKSEETYIRVAGIYACQQIARNSSEISWVILEFLISFIRENLILPLEMDSQDLPEIAPDIQAALKVIAEIYSNEHADRKIDLSHINLSGANLCKVNLHNVNFSHSNLSNVKLNGAILSNAVFVSADLTGAELIKANLTEANLTGAKLVKIANLTGAKLTKADLTMVDFSFSILDETNFQEAKLRGAKFLKCKGLTSQQVKAAEYWQDATYDSQMSNELDFKSTPKIVPDQSFNVTSDES